MTFKLQAQVMRSLYLLKHLGRGSATLFTASEHAKQKTQPSSKCLVPERTLNGTMIQCSFVR